LTHICNLQKSIGTTYYRRTSYGLIRGEIFFQIWLLSGFRFLCDFPQLFFCLYYYFLFK
uniref:Uncharacterized protein n=1 Tax=Mus spicilegus TaxID=10103 RepID=A0A8C6GS89_MUSSI